MQEYLSGLRDTRKPVFFMLQGKEMLGVVLDYGEDFVVIKRFLKSSALDGEFYGERITLIPLSQIQLIDLESEVYEDADTRGQIPDSSGVCKSEPDKRTGSL